MNPLDDEDGDDFNLGAPTQNSKLASLFKSDSQKPSSNDSLMFKAPKQPKKETNEQQTTSSSSQAAIANDVLFFSKVQVFKYVNNNYENQGKTGLALIGNLLNNQVGYSLILYVDKKQPLATIKVTKGFKMIVQANNYASFYDDANQPWSVMFESEAFLMQFATKLTLARCNILLGNLSGSVITQELKLSSNEANAAQTSVEPSDAIEVSNTLTLWKDYKLSDEIENNQSKPFKVKLGKGKLPKTIEECVVNMKLGGRRLIVCQASKLQPFYQNVAADSLLFYDITVLRIKKGQAKDNAEEESQQEESRSRADSIKDKVKALNEQINENQAPKNDKSKLISRMAKMGQQMLPLSGATVAALESEDEDEAQQPKNTQQRAPLPKQPEIQQQQQPSPAYNQQFQNQNFAPISSTQFAAPFPMMNQDASAMMFYQQQLQAQQQQFSTPQAPTNQLALFKPAPQNPIVQFQSLPTQPQQQQPTTTTQSSNIIEEANIRNQQQQQTLLIKLDTINEKLEQVKSLQQLLNNQNSMQMPNMETSILLHNITRIVNENEKYKKELYEKSSKIEELNGKITELLSRNQNIVEKSHALLEQKNESFQSSAEKNALRVLELEQDKMRLTGELSKITAQVSELNVSINSYQQAENELKQRLADVAKNFDGQKQELDRLRIENAEIMAKFERAVEEYRKEKLARKQGEAEIKRIEEEKSELRSSLDDSDRQLAERKAKFESDKRQLNAEIDELKRAHSNEVEELREKLSKIKANASYANSQQVKQLEDELNRDWEVKLEKALSAQEAKANRKYEQLAEEKDEVVKRFEEFTQKVKASRENMVKVQEENESLRQSVDELNEFKEKYEALQSKAVVMKDRYEAKIKELLDAEPDAEIIAEEVKKVMNSIFRKLKNQIKPEEYYVGNGILSAMLKIIKLVTVQMLHSGDEAQGDNDDNVDYFSQHIFNLKAQIEQQAAEIQRLHEQQAVKESELAAATKKISDDSLKQKFVQDLKEQQEVKNEDVKMKSEIKEIEKEEVDNEERKVEVEIVESKDEGKDERSKVVEEKEDEEKEVSVNQEIVGETKIEVVAEEKKFDIDVPSDDDAVKDESDNGEEEEENIIEVKDEQKDVSELYDVPDDSEIQESLEENKALQDQQEIVPKIETEIDPLSQLINDKEAIEENKVEESDKVKVEEKKEDKKHDSMFDSEPPSPPTPEPAPAKTEVKKSKLFEDDDDDMFVTSPPPADNVAPKADVMKNKLFDDDSDDDFFKTLSSKPKNNEKAKESEKKESNEQNSSMFEPPPLLDEDEDNNDGNEWFK